MLELQNNLTQLQGWRAQTETLNIPLSSGSQMNSGDVAWMLTSTALVLLMTLPGVALFYGGMCQAKNVLSTVMQSYSIACMISILWFMFTYSLCFSTGSPVLGNADRFWLIGTRDTNNKYSTYRLRPNSAHALDPTVPESIYMTYQLTFAIITGVLVCGSFAERMRFEAMLTFIFFWHILIYCPVCHSEWAVDGFLAVAGDLDYAGGNVVHICSGLSGLATSIVIGPRKGWGMTHMKPHNIVYTVIGGALLWVGWFGFNAGSAGAAGTSAGFAMMVTHICSATGGFTWMIIEYFHMGKASVLGIVR
jgi:ammonium transporter, Amt family